MGPPLRALYLSPSDPTLLLGHWGRPRWPGMGPSGPEPQPSNERFKGDAFATMGRHLSSGVNTSTVGCAVGGHTVQPAVPPPPPPPPNLPPPPTLPNSPPPARGPQK